MSYFQYFPQTYYSFDDNDQQKSYSLVTNILMRSKVSDYMKNNTTSYVSYTIEDGERPDSLADKIYGKSDYHWIILLINDVINPYFDWPLSSWQLQKQIEETYTGVSLFVDNDSTYVLKNGRSSTFFDLSLPVGTTISQGSVTATVKEWNPQLCKIVVEDITGGSFVANQALTYEIDDVSFSLTIRRIVLDSTAALHHFENSSGQILDPNGDIVEQETDETVNMDLAASKIRNAYLGETSTSNIRSYIFGGNDNVVTNYQYESAINDRKRNIKLLKRNFVDSFVQRFATSLATPIR